MYYLEIPKENNKKYTYLPIQCIDLIRNVFFLKARSFEIIKIKLIVIPL